MPIKKVTPEEKAIREAQDKKLSDYIKEGKTVEEARAIIEAIKKEQNG
jgi:uncharacterized protein YeeX (DUF496 family)